MSGKKAGRIIIAVLRIVLIAILIFNMAVLLLRGADNAEALARIPIAAIEVSGGSMEPTLHNGDGIMTYKTPFSELKAGDIITFARDGELITHTVISVEADRVVTKGDANSAPDAPVTEDEYCTRMLFSFPGMGAVRRIFTSVPRVAVLTVIIALLIFGADIFPAVYTALFDKKKK